MKTISNKNIYSFPKSKQTHHYINLNRNQLQTLSLINDELTYITAVEILKKRQFQLDIQWLSTLLKINIFKLKSALNTLANLSFISLEGNTIKVMA